MKNLSVLQIILPLGMGGVEKIAYTIHHYLISNDVRSYIAINKSMYDKFVEQFQIKNTKNIIKYDDGNIFKLKREFQRIINSISPDVIQTHARKECLLTSLCKYKSKHIRTQHMQELNKIPVSKLEKLILSRRVSMWVATSEKLREKYLIDDKGIPKDKTVTIYNGVNKSDQYKKNDYYTLKNKFCIISRLTVQKGLDILFSKIFKMSPEIKKNIFIDVYGEGDQRKLLEDLSIKLNLNSIIKFHPATKNTVRVVSNYDALLMPSRYEGLPLTMLEAMSVGTPVAAHNVGAINEIIRNNKNGWIIDKENTWETFFQNFVDRKFNYSEISDCAVNTYEKKFTSHYMAEQYLNLYKKIIFS